MARDRPRCLLGLLLCVSWLKFWVLILLMILASEHLRILWMPKIWPMRLFSILVCGPMVAGKTYPTGGFEVAGAGVCVPAPELAMEGAIWYGGGAW